MTEWRAPFGAMSAANWIGMHANQYLHRYGAPREMLGLIAVNARTNAGRNPAAIYRDPMTMDDYMAARPITSPFGLYDCDVPCDGSIAVIVSDASVAGDLPHPAGAHRGRRHPDPRTGLVGPGHGDPRAPGDRAIVPPVDAHRPAPGRRRPRAALRRLHVQRDLVARGPRLLRASARPTTGWTAGGASRWTAICPSTPTGASSPRVGPMASASSTRRCSSCATTPASVRCATPARRWSRRAAGLPRA